MVKIVEIVRKAEKEHGIDHLARRLNVSYSFIHSLLNGKYNKIRPKKLERLYRHYDLPVDKFYIENLQKRYKPNESVLGNLFMVRRIQKGLTVAQVAKKIKGDVRSINRIEAGNSLPSYRGRYILKLLELYDFTEEEENTIKRYIVNLKDMVKILRKYDQEGYTLETVK